MTSHWRSSACTVLQSTVLCALWPDAHFACAKSLLSWWFPCGHTGCRETFSGFYPSSSCRFSLFHTCPRGRQPSSFARLEDFLAPDTLVSVATWCPWVLHHLNQIFLNKSVPFLFFLQFLFLHRWRLILAACWAQLSRGRWRGVDGATGDNNRLWITENEVNKCFKWLNVKIRAWDGQKGQLKFNFSIKKEIKLSFFCYAGQLGHHLRKYWGETIYWDIVKIFCQNIFVIQGACHIV